MGYAQSTFKAATWTRRLENCNYPDGRMIGAVKDSPGIDCNHIKDTSPLTPFFGAPLYWQHMIRDFTPLGWDPELTNADDGASITLQSQVRLAACTNVFCSATNPN